MAEYQKKEKEVEDLQKELDRFRQSQSRLLAEILAARIEQLSSGRISSHGSAEVYRRGRGDRRPVWMKAFFNAGSDYLGRKDHEGDLFERLAEIAGREA